MSELDTAIAFPTAYPEHQPESSMGSVRSIICLLIASLCMSCLSDADAKRMGDELMQVMVQTYAFSAVAVHYRDQNGRWPTDANELRESKDVRSEVDLPSFCDLVTLSETKQGLVVRSKRTGETLFVIGSESSRENGIVFVRDANGK